MKIKILTLSLLVVTIANSLFPVQIRTVRTKGNTTITEYISERGDNSTMTVRKVEKEGETTKYSYEIRRIFEIPEVSNNEERARGEFILAEKSFNFDEYLKTIPELSEVEEAIKQASSKEAPMREELEKRKESIIKKAFDDFQESNHHTK